MLKHYHATLGPVVERVRRFYGVEEPMRNGKWEYTIRAYCPPNRGGGLDMETVHVGEVSRDIEIAAFKARMARGEIGHIEACERADAMLFPRDKAKPGQIATEPKRRTGT